MNLVVVATLGLTGRLKWAWMPVALFVINVALFAVVNVAHGYWIPGIVGLVLVGLVGVQARGQLGRPA